MEALRREAKTLKGQGADILVAVVHADRTMDYEIVRSRVVDIVLTGHDHDLAIDWGIADPIVSEKDRNGFPFAGTWAAQTS